MSITFQFHYTSVVDTLPNFVDTLLVEIDLQVIDSVVVRIATRKMVMAKIEPMTGMAVQKEVMIGMVVEYLPEKREGVIGVGLVLTIAQAEVAVHLRSTVTDCLFLTSWCICGM